MKKTPPKTTAKAARSTSDTLCKRLAEEYPEQFARLLFGATGKLRVIKTELDREPIRADSVFFAHDDREILHTEFQMTMKSEVPVPLRFLDYYVGFKRQDPQRRVRQVLVVLKPTEEEIPDHYEDERTRHSYDVFKVWEQDPEELLKHEGLLPLATLCRTASGAELLGKVAAQIKKIKSPQRRSETLGWSRMLAGLRYHTDLIYRIFKESDMLEESVVYQDILQKGEQRGVPKGKKEMALRQLERKFGKLSPGIRRQFDNLAVVQVEELGDALLDFRTKQDLLAWFKQHAAKN